MHVTGFLGFMIIYMQIFLLNAKTEYRVKVMNDMLTHVGWLEWYQNDNVHIIYHPINDEKFDANNLLDPSYDGRIVTAENVDDKIRQAHQLLSCKYARVLDEFCEYESGLGPECTKMTNPSESLDCLGDFLEMLKLSDSLVMRMQGSLSCLHQLSPQTPVDKELFEILEDFKNYYKNITFDRNSIASGGDKTIIYTVVTQIASVEKRMADTLEQLGAFYRSFCWPSQKDGKISKHASAVENISKATDPNLVVPKFKQHIKEIIEVFEVSFDEGFGFEYNKESKTTTLTYDPDLLRRVKLMNKLLANPGWLALNGVEIRTPPDDHGTVHEFLMASPNQKVVTKANVDEKVQRAHHFLTCKYAVTLKRCCDYARLVWKHCLLLSGSPTYREDFVSTMTTITPLVSSMQDALWHFYRLSSHVKYDRTVSDLLEHFKNYFESEIYEKKNVLVKLLGETSENKIMKKILDIETEMTDVILKGLIKFYEPNCSPYHLIHEKSFEKKADVVKSRILGERFKQDIGELIVSHYNAFGFPFDTSKVKNKGIAK